MPYILSPIIEEEFEGLWNEGAPYRRKNIYTIEEGNLPPVNYDEHILKPHSIAHVEGSKHTQKNGYAIDHYFEKSKESFFGECLLLKFKNPKFISVSPDNLLYHWQISEHELREKLLEIVDPNYQIRKIAITLDDSCLPKNLRNLHDPNYIVTLSEDAANYLISFKGFDAFLTSWKSSDFGSQKNERPIHNILFRKAVIFECLTFIGVPEGKYFFNGFPLPLKNASESPCCPVFFHYSEIL